MTISYNGSTLRLTGGSSGSRLGPANLIADAAAFSSGTSYVVNAITKYDYYGFGSDQLWACTVAGAGAFSPSNWTLLVSKGGSRRTLDIRSHVVIAGYYDDTGWVYDLATGKSLSTGSGVNWTSGFVDNQVRAVGFFVIYDHSWNPLSGGGSSDSVTWTYCTFKKASALPRDIVIQNTAIPGTITGLVIDGTASHGDNNIIVAGPNLAIRDIALYRCNLTVSPSAGLSGINHRGLQEVGVENKIGNPVPNTPLTGYTPNIPANNSSGIGLIYRGANQVFQDINVPNGFSFAAQLKAYYVGMSATFTRTATITAKLGSSLLSGVAVNAINASNGSASFSGATNGSGVFSAVSTVYAGNRTTAPNAYIALENVTDYRQKSVLFRREDLKESMYLADMASSALVITQFFEADPHWTSSQASASIYSANAGTKTVTITASSTADALYDWLKWWLAQSAQMASLRTSPFSGAGAVLNLSDWSVVVSEGTFSAGAKFSTLSCASVTGSISMIYTDPAGTHVTVFAPSLPSGARVQVYNTTDSTEVYNGVPSGAGLSLPVTWTADKTLRLRAAKIGKLPLEATGVLSSGGLAFLSAMADDTVYTANAVDGSTVTEFAPDPPNLQVDITDGDGLTTPQRLYAWMQYYLTTSAGVASGFFGGLTATDTANYAIDPARVDLKLDNQSASPVLIVGGYLYRTDGTTVIAATSGSIQMDPGRAYTAPGSAAITVPAGERVITMQPGGGWVAHG